ncbi:MAG: FAD-dependent oxidoreductase [Burkholderiales bacterium]|nr:FAD-dependent oxidoreductase [Burkholderiales bacterium]
MKILIVGGGPVGLAAALALKQEGVSDDITVLEAAPHGQTVFSDRNIALSASSWRFLARLGVAVAADARAPIRRVEVTQRGAFGLLTLDAGDIGAAELGAASPYPAVKAALDAAVRAAALPVSYGARVASVAHEGAHAVVALTGGERLRADLVVLADGAGSDFLPDFKRFERDSGQMAVLARVSASAPVAGLAIERFTPAGTLALVPRADGQWTLIWARSKVDGERLLALDGASLAQEINAAAGRALGTLTVQSKASSYPLVWRIVEPRASGAVVAIGNAAQGLHPAAAQGLNLGLADARDLARELAGSAGAGITSDRGARLARYARSRGVDRVLRMGFSGLLAYGFDRGGWLLDAPRGLGLMALQLAPPLKRELLRRLALT